MQIVEYVQLVVTSLDFDQSDSSLQVEKTQQGAFRIRHYIVKLGLIHAQLSRYMYTGLGCIRAWARKAT